MSKIEIKDLYLIFGHEKQKSTQDVEKKIRVKRKF